MACNKICPLADHVDVYFLVILFSLSDRVLINLSTGCDLRDVALFAVCSRVLDLFDSYPGSSVAPLSMEVVVLVVLRAADTARERALVG